MKNNLPIKILNTKENEDGSLDIEIEYSKLWVDRVKVDLGKNKITKKDIKEHFLNILTEAVNKTIDKND